MITTRREFMMTIGKGVLVSAALPLFNACAAVGRESTHRNQESDIINRMLNKDHFEILRYAALAPSSHNTQPWEVEIAEPGRWIIKSNPARWLAVVDPENRETTLSMGTFIENLVLAAGSFGYGTEINYLATTLKSETVAELILHKDKQTGYPLHKIANRRTVRTNHLAKVISPEDLKFITADDRSNFHFFPAQSVEGKLLAEATLAANKIQAYRDEAQSELAQWIRWSNTDAEKYHNGLTPASMEISGFASIFVRMFYDKDDVMSKSFREKGIEMVEKQLASFGGWIIVTSDGVDLKSIVECGRTFQRMALNSRERMIAVHPMTQLLEEGMTDEIQSGLGISNPIQFILRTSYLKKYPDPVSLRRPLEWFVV